MYADCWKNKRLWLFVMLLVLVMWATTMIGPGIIGASLFNFLYFAWLGVLAFVSLSIQDWKKYRLKFYFAIPILVLILLNAYFEFRQSFSMEIAYGILLALIGGTSSFIYFKTSQALAKTTHLSASQILAVRFYLSIGVLLVATPLHSAILSLTPAIMLGLVVLAFCSLIIPLYFSQKALEKITSEQHAIINSLCPIVTAILQEIIFADLKVEQVVVYCLYSCLILGAYLATKYVKKVQEAA